MQIVILAAVIVGVVMIVISLILTFVNGKSPAGTDGGGLAGNTVKAIDASVDEMDKTMEEFNRLTKAAFDELDRKYQELLFLYSLIDEKKNAVDQLYKIAPPPTSSVSMPASPAGASVAGAPAAGAKPEPISSHPRHDEIIRLRKQGMNVAEIAKQLDMGQGEVKLIIELGKVR